MLVNQMYMGSTKSEMTTSPEMLGPTGNDTPDEVDQRKEIVL